MNISPASIAVTGIGVITPLGDGPAALANAFARGDSSVTDLSEPFPASVSRFLDFDSTRYANIRGMRVYNRASRLGICATKLALVDSGIESIPFEEVGIIFANRYSHLDSLIDYDRNLMTVGPSRTNPALMPLAIPSAPGAVTALSYGMKAFSITLANGDVSGLDALGLAMRLLQQGRARAAVVVSSASLCNEIVLSASRAGWLAEAQNVRVFDRDTRGAAVGEAAAALVLETLARTAERGGKPKAILGGQASRFAPRREFVSAALSRACRRALELADSTPADIALISSAGNGVPDTDRVEALALLDVLGGEKPPVVAIKATLGETAECSGLLQTIGAISALSTRTAWPIPRLRTPAVPGLNYAMDAIPISGSQALVTSTSLTGACSALLLSLPNA